MRLFAPDKSFNHLRISRCSVEILFKSFSFYVTETKVVLDRKTFLETCTTNVNVTSRQETKNFFWLKIQTIPEILPGHADVSRINISKQKFLNGLHFTLFLHFFPKLDIIQFFKLISFIFYSFTLLSRTHFQFQLT